MAFEPDEHYQRISLRIPRALHEQLMTAARATSKSMNAEIVARLADSFLVSIDEANLVAVTDRLERLVEIITKERDQATLIRIGKKIKKLPRSPLDGD